jgi:phosphatidylserine decarboxylase
MKLAPDSNSWILPPIILSLIFCVLSFFYDENITIILIFISFLLFVIFCFFIIFFRDPDRKIGDNIVAPADGIVRDVSLVKDADIGKSHRISIFMNIYNVHVNRMPFDGSITLIKHLSGSYLPAFKKESDRNERLITLIKTEYGMFKIVQIAGTIARRIVTYLEEGDFVKKGDRIGIIRLGSRVDIYLPIKMVNSINVKARDIIKAGETKIAEIND